MQHHDRARRKVLQVFKHAGAVNAMGGCVVIGVVLHRKAGGFEQSAVVFPARVADGDHGIGQDPLEEVGADLQCASTAKAWLVTTRPSATRGEFAPNSSPWTAMS